MLEGLRRTCQSLKWPVITAMALSGLTLLLGTSRYMGWLDALCLRIVGPAVPAHWASPVNSAGLPLSIVNIDRRAYLEFFGERSPLARNQLASMIDEIVDTLPDVLVIDIDISPAVGEDTDARAMLDRSVARAIARCMSVVIASPAGHAAWLTPDQAEWMNRMRHLRGPRGESVEFASTSLFERFGMVVRYEGDQEPDLLAPVALEATGARLSMSSNPSERPLLPAVLDPVRQLSLSWRIRRAPDGSIRLEAPPIRSAIVLLGGSFNPLDQYLTVVGMVPGIRVHAAALMSEQAASPLYPYHELLRFADYFVDIVLGVALGEIWRALWKSYEAHANKPLFSPSRRLTATAGILLKTILLLGFFVAAVLVPVILVLYVAASFMAVGAWINPGPMLLGMFVDAVRIPGGHHAEHRHGESALTSHQLISLSLATAGLIVLMLNE